MDIRAVERQREAFERATRVGSSPLVNWTGSSPPTRRTQPAINFLMRTEVAENGCWNWTGNLDALGYAKSRGESVHRALLVALGIDVPQEMTVDHLCVNPRCVNPQHMDLVTLSENVARSNSPASVNARKTHCIYGHEFTPENTYRSPKTGHRKCRTCSRRIRRQRVNPPPTPEKRALYKQRFRERNADRTGNYENPCPKCGSAAGWACQTPTGQWAPPHASRYTITDACPGLRGDEETT